MESNNARLWVGSRRRAQVLSVRKIMRKHKEMILIPFLWGRPIIFMTGGLLVAFTAALWASPKVWPNLGPQIHHTRERLQLHVPTMQEHGCGCKVPGQGFGSWVYPVANDQHLSESAPYVPDPCPVSMLFWGPGASPLPVMLVHMPAVLVHRSFEEWHSQGRPSVLIQI